MARSLRHLAVGVFAAVAALAVATAAATAVAALREAELPEGAWTVALLAVCSLAPGSVGLFVALRRPANRVAWILLLGALAVALVLAASVAASVLLDGDPDAAAGRWAALIQQQWPVLFLWPLALAFVFPEPQPGDVLHVNSLLFTGDHRRHAKRWTGSTRLRCVFASAGEPRANPRSRSAAR